MKPFLDFFPVLLFVVVYFAGGLMPAQTFDIANLVLDDFVRGGAVPLDLAPLMLATAAAIAAIIVQVLLSVLLRHHITGMQWATFAVFLTLGSATIYFHNEVFIKVKPTVLYWILALVFLASERMLGRNLIKAMMEPAGVNLPPSGWARLNLAWVGFFLIVGVINLYVAFAMSRDFWVSFKLFGITGLTLLFAIVQSLFLARHMEERVTPESTVSLPPHAHE